MDQRKVNMLARDYAHQIQLKDKPIILSHHMMMGLKEGQAKMSKSDPDSAIFMEDSIEEVNKKIKKSFCPPGVIKENPVLDYCKHIIFDSFDGLTIKRKAENGGDLHFATCTELETFYQGGTLHPDDLKKAVAECINKLLQPVRDHFEKDPYAKKLLDTIKIWQAESHKKKMAAEAKKE